MVVRVAQQAAKAEGIDEVAVATDDERIAHAVTQAGFRALITDPSCRNGTERIAQAARDLPADGYLNVQGDEPLVDPRAVEELARLLRGGAEMATLARPLEEGEEQLPQIVREAAGGLAGANLSVINGAEGLSQVAAGLVAQGISILDTVKKGLSEEAAGRSSPARPAVRMTVSTDGTGDTDGSADGDGKHPLAAERSEHEPGAEQHCAELDQRLCGNHRAGDQQDRQRHDLRHVHRVHGPDGLQPAGRNHGRARRKPMVH